MYPTPDITIGKADQHILRNDKDCTSEIAQFFQNQSILLTGGTGFIGKAILEKLLRSCPQLETIYILLRPKKGLNPDSRLKDLLEDPLFNRVKHEQPHNLSKVVSIEGDISLPGLGMSSEDELKLIQDVSIVMHAAATIRFNESLKKAVNINFSGTKRLMDLCKRMNRLTVLVHVSTAYANCHLETVDEIIYPLKADVNELCAGLASMSDQDNLTPGILENRPNSYTFTKAMTECALKEEETSIPIAIVRPSLVTGIWRELMPGWTSGILGINGIPVLWGNGILRSLRVNGQNLIDLIPVDVVVNLCIAAAWELGTSDNKDLRVYNCCSGDQNPLKWDELRNIFNTSFLTNPYHSAVCFPYVRYTSNATSQRLANLYKHYMPAVLLDIGCALVGKKRRALSIYKNLKKLENALRYFQTRGWNFNTTRSQELYLKMSFVDWKTFNFDIKELNWNAYLEAYTLGVRKYILKQKDDTLPESRRKMKRLFKI